MENNSLTHWGIKGMKWGRRRYQNKDGTLTPAGKKRYSAPSDNSKQVASRKNDYKNRRTLSDADLKKKIERLKMEKEFRQLTKEDIEPGKTFVADVMSSASKKALTVAAAGAMAYGVKVAMTREFDIKEAAAFVAANPNKKK